MTNCCERRELYFHDFNILEKIPCSFISEVFNSFASFKMAVLHISFRSILHLIVVGSPCAVKFDVISYDQETMIMFVMI